MVLGVAIPLFGIAAHNLSVRAAGQAHYNRVTALQRQLQATSSAMAEARAVAGRAAARAGDSAEREETRAQAREERQVYEKRAAEREAEVRDIQQRLDQLNPLVLPRNWPAVASLFAGLAAGLAGIVVIVRHGGRRVKLALAILGGGVVAAGGTTLVVVRIWRAPPPAVAPATSPEGAPQALQVTHDGGTVLVHYLGASVHHVLFAPEGGSTAVGDSRNTQSLLWQETGSVRLKQGRSYSYLRRSTSPEMLDVNGEEFDLRHGEVIVLHGDGGAEQLKLFPSMAEARDPRMMGIFVKNARDLETGPPTMGKLQQRLAVAEAQLKKLLETHAAEHPVVEKCRQEIADLKQELEGRRR
jgi:hypothetical protein